MSVSPELLEKVERTERLTRIGRPLLIIGIASVVAALLVLSFYLNGLREQAVEKQILAETALNETSVLANSTATTLEAVKVALADGDMAKASELLEISINQQETAAENSSEEIGGQPQIVQQTEAVIDPKVEAVLASRIRTAPNTAVTRVPQRSANQRVFVHFAGSLERTQIIDLQLGLKDAGWNVQGASGERVKSAPRQNEVRYHSDSEASGARALAKAISGQRILRRPVTIKQMDVVRPGVLEVWLSQ